MNIQPCVAYTLKIRGGCEGGGKGALVQEDMSATLATLNDQTIFQQTCMDAGCHHCAGFKFHQGSKAGSIGFEEENSPTITADWHVPAVMYSEEVVRGCDPRAIANQDQTLFQQANILLLNDQGGSVMSVSEEISPTLRAQTHGHEPIVIDRAAFSQGLNAKYNPHIEETQVMDTLVATGPHAFGAGTPMQVRRLTPRECERLQGFPDDWTMIPWKGKDAEACPDSPRYKALGNSMAVPVMRWIGERIDAVYSGAKVVEE